MRIVMLKATERLERLVSMVPWLIENNGATINELVDRFQYPRETLLNDLTKVLFFVGPHPHTPDNLIEINLQDDEVWISQANYLARPLNLTYAEAFSLLAKGKMLLQLIDVDSAHSSLVSALDKVANCIGANQDQVVIDPGVRDSEIYQITNKSLLNRKKMAINYYSFNEDYLSDRTIQPLGLGINDRYLYLRAYCEVACDFRTFRMDRIIYAEVSDEDIDTELLEGLEVEPVQKPIDFDFQFPEEGWATLLVKESDSWIVSKYPTTSVIERENNMLEVTLPVSSNIWLGRLLLQLDPETILIKAASGVATDAGYSLTKRILSRYGLDD
tara:strand:- start:687 stop:1673 length:987 start_codon:yes stop_codon:yes gene_type:complete